MRGFWLGLMAASFLAPAVSLAADPVAALADGCAACHGTDGHGASPLIPAISGRSPDELRRLLRDYKAGVRDATIMDRIAGAYSDDQLDAIAVHFASRRK